MTYLNRISSIKTLDNPISESVYDYSTFLSDINENIRKSHTELNSVACSIVESAINLIVENKPVEIDSSKEEVDGIDKTHKDFVLDNYKKLIEYFYGKICKEVDLLKEFYSENKKAVLTTKLSDKFGECEELCKLIPNMFDCDQVIKFFKDVTYEIPEYISYSANDIELNKHKLDGIIECVCKNISAVKDEMLNKKCDASLLEKFSECYVSNSDIFRKYISNMAKYIECIRKVIDLYSCEDCSKYCEKDSDPVKDYENDKLVSSIESNNMAESSPTKKEVDKLNAFLESCYNTMVRDAISIKSKFIDIMTESADADVNDAVKKSIPKSVWDNLIRLIKNIIETIKSFWRNVVMTTRSHFGTYSKWYNKNKTKLENAKNNYDGSAEVKGYIFIADSAINEYKTDNIKQAVGKIINKVNTTDIDKMKAQIEKVSSYTDEDIYKAITKDLTGTQFKDRNTLVDSFKNKYKIDDEKDIKVSRNDIVLSENSIAKVAARVDELNVKLKKHSFDDELTSLLEVSEKFKNNKDNENIVAQYYKSMYRVYSVAQRIVNDIYKFKIDLYEKQAYYSFKVLKEVIK